MAEKKTVGYRSYVGKTIPQLVPSELKEAYYEYGRRGPVAFCLCVAASLWKSGAIKPEHTVSERKRILKSYLGHWVMTLPL